MHQSSPLDLKGYFIEEFSLKMIGTFDKGKSSDPFVGIGREHLVNARSEFFHFMRMEITVRPRRPNTFPYSIKLKISGGFVIEESFYQRDKGWSAEINGSSILYGAAREYIFAATAHCPHGPFLLPTVSFLPSIKKDDAEAVASSPPDCEI
jgi:preprotein translocase subunit SecB